MSSAELKFHFKEDIMSNGGAKLKRKVEALQRDTASLFKLLGGDEDDRLRFWEKMKGITTPAVFRLVEHQLDTMQGLVKQVQINAKALEKEAGKISR
jgi:hypothetical protein